MRAQPALLAALLLAGCSAFEVAPAPTPSSATPSVPTLTPSEARPSDDCARVSFDMHEPREAEASRLMGVSFRVLVQAACATPLELAYGGRCPRSYLLVRIALADAPEWSGELLGDGPAYRSGVPCPPHEGAPAFAPAIPSGDTLSREFSWNATFADACEHLPSGACWSHAPAPNGTYELSAAVYGAAGELWSGARMLRLYDLCADIRLDDPAPGDHVVELTIDGREHFTIAWIASEPRADPRIRWCGDPGEHVVRYQDPVAGVDETARLVLDDTEIVLRPRPLRRA